MNEQIDSLAERIKTLGSTPYHRYSEYLEHASLSEFPFVEDADEALNLAFQGFQHLLSQARKLMKQAASYEDEGSVVFLSSFIAEVEKILWMLGTVMN